MSSQQESIIAKNLCVDSTGSSVDITSEPLSVKDEKVYQGNFPTKGTVLTAVGFGRTEWQFPEKFSFSGMDIGQDYMNVGKFIALNFTASGCSVTVTNQGGGIANINVAVAAVSIPASTGAERHYNICHTNFDYGYGTVPTSGVIGTTRLLTTGTLNNGEIGIYPDAQGIVIRYGSYHAGSWNQRQGRILMNVGQSAVLGSKWRANAWMAYTPDTYSANSRLGSWFGIGDVPVFGSLTLPTTVGQVTNLHASACGLGYKAGIMIVKGGANSKRIYGVSIKNVIAGTGKGRCVLLADNVSSITFDMTIDCVGIRDGETYPTITFTVVDKSGTSDVTYQQTIADDADNFEIGECATSPFMAMGFDYAPGDSWDSLNIASTGMTFYRYD